MMKKKYMTPEMEIFEIKAQQQLLAGSATVPFGGDEEPSVSPGGSDAPFMDMDELLGF